MRANVRPFVREYKSRSRETALHSPKKWFASGEEAQTQNRQRDFCATPLHRVQKEAEIDSMRKDIRASPLASTNEEQGGAQFTGRVLPCLLQEPLVSDIQDAQKTSRSGRSRSSHVTKRRPSSRAEKSLEISAPANSKCAQSTLRSASVSDEFLRLSDLEILSLIERAKAELDRRKEDQKEKLRSEIEAKLKSAGLDLGDLFESERKRSRGAGKAKEDDGQNAVAPKYRNHVTGETWSGRGRSPKWVVAIMQEREWTVDDFKQSHEFLIP